MPPPHVTAYFSNRRQPGVVLRVSRICARVPLTASTNWAVKVAMPQRRWRKFRATRSALSSARAGPAISSKGLPPATRWPSCVARVTCTCGGKRPKGRFGQGQTGDHQRLARAHHRFGLGGFGHGGQGRHIAAADVLGQGEGYRATDLFCCHWFHTRSMHEMPSPAKARCFRLMKRGQEVLAQKGFNSR